MNFRNLKVQSFASIFALFIEFNNKKKPRKLGEIIKTKFWGN